MSKWSSFESLSAEQMESAKKFGGPKSIDPVEIDLSPLAKLSGTPKEQTVTAYDGTELYTWHDANRYIHQLGKFLAQDLIDRIGSLSDTVIVSRHDGAIEWLRKQGVQGEVIISHVSDSSQVEGKVVYGNVPLHLAAKAAQVVAIDINIPAEFRGKDLSPAEMDEFGAKLRRYVVTAID